MCGHSIYLRNITNSLYLTFERGKPMALRSVSVNVFQNKYILVILTPLSFIILDKNLKKSDFVNQDI